MKYLRLGFFFALIVWPLFLLGEEKADAPAGKPGQVVLLNVSGAIGPATSDYLSRGLEKAKEMEAQLVVIRMNTPGGLDSAMREIIQNIIASPVPVAVFVAPSGARAASAGTYILYGSHVAAMAPATNLGAATPVQIGGVPDPGGADKTPKPPEPDKATDKEKSKDKDKAKKDEPPKGSAMERKVVHDAAAYIRGLAQMRGRNVEWAERAVREAVSLTAEEAVKQNVVDLLAKDVTELLAKVDGRKVNVLGQDRILKTSGLVVVTIDPDWRNRFLSVITDPNIAYILMMLGMYGLFFELWNPGYVLPGVIGGICLLLALYAFQLLPINYAGLALILLGVAFMVAEAFMPSFGALGIGGVISFVAGSIILMETDIEGYRVAWELIGAIAVVSAGIFIGIAAMAMRIRRRPSVSGSEAMVGTIGEALEDFDKRGRVRVYGEEWQATTARPVIRGKPVRITAVSGLLLTVEPVDET